MSEEENTTPDPKPVRTSSTKTYKAKVSNNHSRISLGYPVLSADGKSSEGCGIQMGGNNRHEGLSKAQFDALKAHCETEPALVFEGEEEK